MFITEVVVAVGVGVECIILRGISNTLSLSGVDKILENTVY